MFFVARRTLNLHLCATRLHGSGKRDALREAFRLPILRGNPQLFGQALQVVNRMGVWSERLGSHDVACQTKVRILPRLDRRYQTMQQIDLARPSARMTA